MGYKIGDQVEYKGEKDWKVEEVYVENGVEMLKIGRTVPLYDSIVNGVNQTLKKIYEGKIPDAVKYVTSSEVVKIPDSSCIE